MIRHIVLWTMNGADAAEKAAQAAEVARRLLALDGVVPQLRSISAGAEAVYPGANADVALVADFDSVADLEAYQVHPAHVAAADYIRTVVVGRTAVDFEL